MLCNILTHDGGQSPEHGHVGGCDGHGALHDLALAVAVLRFGQREPRCKGLELRRVKVQWVGVKCTLWK